jgi:hypothetical protein
MQLLTAWGSILLLMPRRKGSERAAFSYVHRDTRLVSAALWGRRRIAGQSAGNPAVGPTVKRQQSWKRTKSKTFTHLLRGLPLACLKAIVEVADMMHSNSAADMSGPKRISWDTRHSVQLI